MYDKLFPAYIDLVTARERKKKKIINNSSTIVSKQKTPTYSNAFTDPEYKTVYDGSRIKKYKNIDDLF